jgi:hypothetical protein
MATNDISNTDDTNLEDDDLDMRDLGDTGMEDDELLDTDRDSAL